MSKKVVVEFDDLTRNGNDEIIQMKNQINAKRFKRSIAKEKDESKRHKQKEAFVAKVHTFDIQKMRMNEKDASFAPFFISSFIFIFFSIIILFSF